MGWGWSIPSINRATAQRCVMDQLFGEGENCTVSWERISEDQPRGTPLAIFQIFEKTTIEGIGDAA